jgi:hypothetical protein
MEAGGGASLLRNRDFERTRPGTKRVRRERVDLINSGMISATPLQTPHFLIFIIA